MKPPPDSILITSYDLKRLFCRLWPNLKRLGIFLFCLTFIFLLFREPRYLAKATFKHLAKQSDFSPFAKDLFKELSFPSQNSPVFSIMYSNEVLKNAVKKLGLVIIPNAFLDRLKLKGKNVLKNLGCEVGIKPSDIDHFGFTNVSFEKEKSFNFYLKPLTSTTFEVFNKAKKKIAFGELGKPVYLSNSKFTLFSFPHDVIMQKWYAFKIMPWITTVEKIKKTFEIRQHKLDKDVFNLYFQSSDRKLASQFLNQVMMCYQEYYQQENEEMYETQVAYLEKRQAELIKQFDAALKEHTAYLKKNIGETGCMGFSNELDVLAEPQNLFTSKLFDVDLELKRFEFLYTDPYLSCQESPDISTKKLNKAVQTTPYLKNLEQNVLNSELYCDRLQTLISESVKPNLKKSLLSEGKDLFPSEKNVEEDGRDIFRTHDSRNVKQLSHLSQGQEQNILKIDAFKDPLNSDALTLESAKTLYLPYIGKRDQLEAQLREHIFLRNRLDNPDFELSSLSTFLTDPVSMTLAQNASAIALKIRDGENRTVREQERLKEELDTQKRFLYHHLSHMIELEKLQLKLISQKIDSLQLQTRHLLDAEKHLLQEKINELKQKMTSLPEKWHRENLLFLKKDLGSRIIGTMTQLVESKILNQKLYQVSSKHLDLSIPPFKPNHPNLLLHSLLSAFIGCFIFYVYQFCVLLIKGFPASHRTLKDSGFHSCGLLSPLCDKPFQNLQVEDMETLRSVSHFIDAHLKSKKRNCISLVTGKHPDCSANLAELLAFLDKKILIVHHLANNDLKPEETFDLSCTLKTPEKALPIVHHASYDELFFRNHSHYAIESLKHPAFLKILTIFKQQYDIVLLQSNVLPSRKDACILTELSDALVVAVRDESLEDLSFYKMWVEKNESQSLAFICFD